MWTEEINKDIIDKFILSHNREVEVEEKKFDDRSVVFWL